MERIGIAASKMAQGNIFLYNFYVVLISFLFSLFIFVVTGSSILFALIIISYVGDEVMAHKFGNQWTSVFTVCMISLTMVIVVFNLFAISKNIKISKPPK